MMQTDNVELDENIKFLQLLTIDGPVNNWKMLLSSLETELNSSRLTCI